MRSLIFGLVAPVCLYCACVGDEPGTSATLPDGGTSSGQPPQGDSGPRAAIDGGSSSGDPLPDGGGGGLTIQARALAAGGRHSCAISAGKTVRCWGANEAGQLGRGNTSAGAATTVADTLNVSNAVHVAAGGEHSCAILADGTVQCWGLNERGQLGDGTRELHSEPVAVKDLKNAVALSLGGAHSCALLADGTVWCWGGNQFGAVGDGTKGDDRLTPVKVQGLTGGRAIAAGSAFTCAATEAKKVLCWGFNEDGEIGVSASAVPVLEPTLLGLSGVESISAGSRHVCVTFGTEASCWGTNYEGELGDGTYADTHIPVHVQFIGNIGRIAAGSVSTCGVSPTGETKCWGYNPDGRFGNGTTDSYPKPQLADNTAVSTAPGVRLDSPALLAMGGGHVCALVSSRVYCWGDNSFGQSKPGAASQLKFATEVVGAN